MNTFKIYKIIFISIILISSINILMLTFVKPNYSPFVDQEIANQVYQEKAKEIVNPMFFDDGCVFTSIDQCTTYNLTLTINDKVMHYQDLERFPPNSYRLTIFNRNKEYMALQHTKDLLKLTLKIYNEDVSLEYAKDIDHLTIEIYNSNVNIGNLLSSYQGKGFYLEIRNKTKDDLELDLKDFFITNQFIQFRVDGFTLTNSTDIKIKKDILVMNSKHFDFSWIDTEFQDNDTCVISVSLINIDNIYASQKTVLGSNCKVNVGIKSPGNLDFRNLEDSKLQHLSFESINKEMLDEISYLSNVHNLWYRDSELTGLEPLQNIKLDQLMIDKNLIETVNNKQIIQELKSNHTKVTIISEKGD